jgi:hypothetical protein
MGMFFLLLVAGLGWGLSFAASLGNDFASHVVNVCVFPIVHDVLVILLLLFDLINFFRLSGRPSVVILVFFDLNMRGVISGVE